MKIGGNLCNRCSLSFIFVVAAGLIFSGLAFGRPSALHAQEQAYLQPIDLMFVIDNSGSMRQNDPEHNTPEVVKTFIHQLPQQARVGMVLFDQKADLLEPLTDLDSEASRQQFEASLAKFDYRGQFTNSAVGIERALYELKNNGRPDAQRCIVFITDGIIDTGNPEKDTSLTQWLIQDLTTEIKAQQVRIFGIAFTEAADFALIQAMALRTNGDYYRTYEATAILGVLDDILIKLQTPPATPEPENPPATAQEEVVPAESPPHSVEKIHERALALLTKTINTVKESLNGNGMQMLFVALTLVFTLLAAVMVFFYLKSDKTAKSEPTLPIINDEVPDAYLVDLAPGDGQTENQIKLEKQRLTIGRDARNAIIIEKPTISSFHATIECKNMIFYLEDQRSTNGTKLNDQRLEPNMPARLKNGDIVQFSTFKFKFILPEQIAGGETIMVSMTPLEEEESGETRVVDLSEAEGEQGLVTCTQNHLMQLYSLGAKYQEFTKNYLAYDTLEIIGAKAKEALTQSEADGQQHCLDMTKDKTFYLVCSLPVPIKDAAQWYQTHYGGFTKFIMKWAQSETYIQARCETLCIFTFGQDPATWVSLTIVPTQAQADPVEIMSVDFLNEEEKAMLALDFDNHGRVM